MKIQLTEADYQPPGDLPCAKAEQHVYLAAHEEGWRAFVREACTEITEDLRPRGMVPGKAAVQRTFSSETEEAGFNAGFDVAVTQHFQRVTEAIAQLRSQGAESESPVGPVDRVDLIKTKDDGKVELYIVATRPLDTSERTALAFATKLRNYCLYVKHESFAQEFGKPSKERVSIVLRSDWEVPRELIELMAQVRAEAKAPVGLVVAYENL
jgi:hypothetical protein